MANPDPNEGPTIGFARLGGGITGGIGGPSSSPVTQLSNLISQLADDNKRIVYISGPIVGNTVINVGSNKSILGINGATLNGIGLRVLEKSNVIIRNVKISKVLSDVGSAITIQGTTAQNVWVDHCDLSSDNTQDEEYYGGLLDITHGARYITVTWTYFHDHWKASLVGDSDNNEEEDVNILVTYAYNYWKNINSRTPSY